MAYAGGAGKGVDKAGGAGGRGPMQQNKFPNYIGDMDAFGTFLDEYRDPTTGELKYINMARDIGARTRATFDLELDDMAAMGHNELCVRITANILGFLEELSRVIDTKVPYDAVAVQDPIDYMAKEARESGAILPGLLTRRYELVVVPLAAARAAPVSIRGLKSAVIGSLSVIRGICVAATAIRPRLTMLTSVCEMCGEATFQQVVGDRVTPQLVCSSVRCKMGNVVGRLMPQYKACKFKKFQELRLQEMPSDVPKGAIPRTMNVMVEGEQTRIATPGSTVKIIGVYVPDPGANQGQQGLKASTAVKTVIKAVSIELDKRSYEAVAEDSTLREKIDDALRFPDREALIDKICRSIAPEIFGHEDVKKVLLCQLVGGTAITDGMSIRGDINICLMGDPGVAKSQLLKWVSSIAPRSVFTTGRGSSGVGLTAAVTKDVYTGETVLEGGALVLSDKGICCIDEFDKMDENDRTSLHEVMEQQSVSIAKAGIITTLNARTSILAASNPKFGRWRRNVSPSENVNLPPALLSRFDVLWLLLDEPDRDHDSALSMHVTYVHLYGVAPGRAAGATQGGATNPSTAHSQASEMHNEFFSQDFLRAFVGEAKRFQPVIDDAARRQVTEMYIAMRRQAVRNENVVTTRTLLSLIRLAQAIAKVRMSDQVTEGDIREACRLVDCSKASLQDRSEGKRFGGGNTVAGVLTAIKDFAQGQADVSLADLRSALVVKGVSEELLKETLEVYGSLGVLLVDASGSTLSFVA